MKRLALLSLILFFILFTTHCDDGGKGGIIGDPIEMFAVAFLGTPTGAGYIEVPFNADIDEDQFINVVVDLNNDGVWEDYEVDGELQKEWVVENMPALVFSSVINSFTFALNDFDAITRTDLLSRAVLTDEPIDASVFPNGWDGTDPEMVVDRVDFIVFEIMVDDFGDIWSEDIEGTTGFSGGLVPEAGAQGVEFFHSGTPDIDQGFNECVPTSIANCLLWLADKFNFKDKLPSASGNISAETALINLLKNVFSWTTSGVKIVPRKADPVFLNFVDDTSGFLAAFEGFRIGAQLLIEMHQAGNKKDNQIHEKIAAEIAKGQCVVIDMSYQVTEPDAINRPSQVPLILLPGDRRGGHMVTVVATFKGGEIGIHDPLTKAPGFGITKRKMDIYKLDGTRVVDYRFGIGKETHVRYAFAISPKPGLKPAPTPTPVQPPPATPTPTPMATPMPTPMPTPIPTPVPEPVKQEGLYMPTSGNCGITQTFGLVHTEEGNIRIFGFGTNTGHIIFDKTGNPLNFDHPATDIIILGVSGHMCNMICNEAGDQITVTCTRPGASCTHNFAFIPGS